MTEEELKNIKFLSLKICLSIGIDPDKKMNVKRMHSKVKGNDVNVYSTAFELIQNELIMHKVTNDD